MEHHQRLITAPKPTATTKITSHDHAYNRLTAAGSDHTSPHRHPFNTSHLAAVARHLQTGGLLFIEAFLPDPTRFDAEGRHHEERSAPQGSHHAVTSHHDPTARRIHVVHTLTNPHGRSRDYEVTLHYLTPGELDTIANAAGFTLSQRWHDWTTTTAHAASRDPISVYQLRREGAP